MVNPLPATNLRARVVAWKSWSEPSYFIRIDDVRAIGLWCGDGGQAELSPVQMKDSSGRETPPCDTMRSLQSLQAAENPRELWCIYHEVQ